MEKKSGAILQLLHNVTFSMYGQYSAKPKVFPFIYIHLVRTNCGV